MCDRATHPARLQAVPLHGRLRAPPIGGCFSAAVLFWWWWLVRSACFLTVALHPRLLTLPKGSLLCAREYSWWRRHIRTAAFEAEAFHPGSTALAKGCLLCAGVLRGRRPNVSAAHCATQIYLNLFEILRRFIDQVSM